MKISWDYYSQKIKTCSKPPISHVCNQGVTISAAQFVRRQINCGLAAYSSAVCAYMSSPAGVSSGPNCSLVINPVDKPITTIDAIAAESENNILANLSWLMAIAIKTRAMVVIVHK